MYRKLLVAVLIGLLLVAGASVARADEPDLGFPWQDHAAPFTVRFNNLIDTHQQTRLLPNGWLQGYIYIQVTGTTPEGIPIARRANCNDPSLDCRVGWEVVGRPVQGATLIQKGPRLWRFAPEALPADLEFGHFHWMGGPQKPCGLVLNDVEYSGYLFKRTAVTTFYWLGGNEDKETGRLVTPGLDLHSNLEGRWTGGGGHSGEPGGEEGGCGEHDTGDDTGCGGHDTGGEPGGEEGGCGEHDTGDDTACGGHDTGGEPGGDTGGCEGH